MVEELAHIMLIFIAASFLGWLMELFYRNVIDKENTFNPGFLNGPYLPIHGFGVLFLYLISSLQINVGYKILLFIFSTTTLELLTGAFFLYYFDLRLWDYRKHFLNFKGLVCPLFSLYWLLLAMIFYKVAYPFLSGLLTYVKNTEYVVLVVGFVYGIFITDVFSSFRIVFRIKRKIAEINKKHIKKIKIDYRLFKKKIMLDLKTRRANFIERNFLPLSDIMQKDLIVLFQEYVDGKLNKSKKKPSSKK